MKVSLCSQRDSRRSPARTLRAATLPRRRLPRERSDLSHWRKWLGDKLGLLLAESLRVAHESGALRTKDLARVTVDATLQPKNITFPTEAKLLHAAIKGLARLAKKHGVRLRQSYLRIGKWAVSSSTRALQVSG